MKVASNGVICSQRYLALDLAIVLCVQTLLSCAGNIKMPALGENGSGIDLTD